MWNEDIIIEEQDPYDEYEHEEESIIYDSEQNIYDEPKRAVYGIKPAKNENEFWML